MTASLANEGTTAMPKALGISSTSDPGTSAPVATSVRQVLGLLLLVWQVPTLRAKGGTQQPQLTSAQAVLCIAIAPWRLDLLFLALLVHIAQDVADIPCCALLAAIARATEAQSRSSHALQASTVQ